MLRILKWLKPYSVLVLFVVLFMFGQAMAELYLPTIMSEVVNEGMLKGDNGYILTKGSLMLLVALISSVCAIVGSFISARISIGFGRDLRNKVFERVSGYSQSEFDRIGTASLITRTTNDIVQVQTVLVMMFRFMIYAPVMCIGGVVMALSKDKELTIILAVAIPVIVIIMASVASAAIPLFKSMQKKLDRLNLVMRESLIGVRVIRAFNKLGFEFNRFETANRELTDTSIRINKIMAAMQPVMMLMMNAITVAVIWFGGLRIDSGSLGLGDMMAFMQYAMQILFSFVMVSIMFIMIPRAEASAVRVNEVLGMENEIIDPENPERADIMRGHVEFRDVGFSYPGSDEPVLSGISFTAGPGETTAIIGGTGSGKSTLISLIPRFYDATEGQVLVNGADVRDLTQESLRSRIGFAPQAAVLFSGTVAENIRMGREDATDEEVIHAAEVAQAHPFISAMDEGYDSPISQGGTNISGGQKQRLSIARAVVARPEIYIFDDTFSALDYKTDALLRAALKSETRDCAVIIVAQRVSTVMDADRIIVLDDGKIVGLGTHRELLKSCPVYLEIVRSQLSEEEIAG